MSHQGIDLGCRRDPLLILFVGNPPVLFGPKYRWADPHSMSCVGGIRQKGWLWYGVVGVCWGSLFVLFVLLLSALRLL